MTTTGTGVDRRELEQLDRRLETIERSSQTITGLVNSLAQSQSLFEYKHEQAKRVSEKLENLVEKINERGDNQLQRVEDMLDDREARLNDSIRSHREILMLEIANKSAPIAQFAERMTKAEDDIKGLNKIIWMAMGGAAVISFLIEKLFSIVS
jgi:23S rRNA pseudoU1915 N3-methylase RlmH